MFVLLTVYFYVDYLGAKAKLSTLRAEWSVMEPQSKDLQKLEQEVQNTLKPERDFLAAFVATERPLTHYLAWLSEALPEKIWLVELKMDRGANGESLFIKGLSLPSKEKSSIEHIENYLNQLKQKMPDADLTLTTTRQTTDNVEMTQFIANFQWGEAEAAKS